MLTIKDLKSILKRKEGYRKAAFSAYRERSIGLGAMGFTLTSN